MLSGTFHESSGEVEEGVGLPDLPVPAPSPPPGPAPGVCPLGLPCARVPIAVSVPAGVTWHALQESGLSPGGWSVSRLCRAASGRAPSDPSCVCTPRLRPSRPPGSLHGTGAARSRPHQPGPHPHPHPTPTPRAGRSLSAQASGLRPAQVRRGRGVQASPEGAGRFPSGFGPGSLQRQ